LGIAPNIVTKRLGEFVDAGEHAEYVLTAKGLDLKPLVVALTEWSGRRAATSCAPAT
jgi:DNA-binding HxlR family transcriptional regulator